MAGSGRLGMAIAGLFVVVVLGYWLFGGRHENWFVRTAQEAAARCMTQSHCTMLTAEGRIVRRARPPLTLDDACARTTNWRQLKGVSNGQTEIVLTCTGRKTYLFHLGTLPGRKAGNSQWMRCADSGCTAEAKFVTVR